MKTKILASFKNYNEIASTVYSTIFFIIMLSLFFGAMIIIGYLIQIRFSPFLTLEAISSLIALSAPVGLIIVTFSFLILFYSPFLCRHLLKNRPIFNFLVKDKLLYSHRIIRDEDFAIKDRIRIIISYIITMFAGINIFIGTWYYCPHYVFQILFFSGLTGCILAPTLYSEKNYITPIKQITRSTSDKIIYFITESCKAVLTLMGAIVILYLSLFIISKLQMKDFFTTKTVTGTELKILFFSCVSSFYITSPLKKSYNLTSVLISSLCVFAVIFPTLDFTNYCGSILRYFKAGDMQAVNLIVDKKACNILALGGFPVECSKPYQLVKNIDVLWRFGEYYLKYTGKNGSTQIKKYFILPSTDAWLSNDQG